jgi:hypothetical protein
MNDESVIGTKLRGLQLRTNIDQIVGEDLAEKALRVIELRLRTSFDGTVSW